MYYYVLLCIVIVIIMYHNVLFRRVYCPIPPYIPGEHTELCIILTYYVLFCIIVYYLVLSHIHHSVNNV